MRKTLFAAGLLVTLPLASGQSAHPLVGKDVAVPSVRFPAEWYPKAGALNESAPIAGAPYSATMTTTTEVLDSEGKSIATSVQRTLEWRDSAGRRRQEELWPEIDGRSEAFAGIPHQITAVDTVHHCQFTWSAPIAREQDREAVVYCSSLEVSRKDDSHARQMTDPMPKVEHEQIGNITATIMTTPLGKRTLQGLEVVGIRSVKTEVDATGRLQRTNEGETWWSPALYESILTTVKTGQNRITFEMTQIKTVEPHADLFYPPEGYHINKQAELPPLPVPSQP